MTITSHPNPPAKVNAEAGQRRKVIICGWILTPQWAMYLLGLPAGLTVGLLTYLVIGQSQSRERLD